ncbi:MAG: efflux RND transporter periplasmic adaptor subunit [Gammaproteobacteria bacterium]|nr:efflux RND transporter periplasmic adaptor subunit [Gammaproteobacteria bacterium]MBU1444116.1 efflux RND transporter periplasmic adaptor subunit [Gammaproteobacteria bacterium]MBU2408573.1 efflux RND transporter periplasmic adaptor subunit [Gammaproteobacteria bacterium]
MKRSLKWALVVLAVVLVAGALFRATSARRAQQAAATAAPSETVLRLAASDVVRVTEEELARTLPVSGTLRAVDSAVIKARVAGELTGLTVREGDTVAAGQVIARIDPGEYRSRVRQAQEQADSAQAQVAVAQRTFDNNQALVAQGFISRTALDTSQANLNAARSTHRAALAAVDLARKSLDDTVLRSPIAGQVAQRLVQPGERVSIDTRIVEVIDLRQIELEATLSAADSVAVRLGQRASLAIEGGASGGATGPLQLNATVARINPSAQAGSRSVLVYLRLEQSDGLRQGLFAQGAIDVGRERALALPLGAVRVDKPAPYVQLVVDGRIVHRPVETGQRGQVGGRTLVAVRGVEAGAAVVAGSVGPMREGTAVRLATSASP